MNRSDLADQITENQHSFKKLEVDISRYITDKNPKCQFEFQELGIELDKWFKKKCWFIFYRPEAELSRIKEAFKICQDKGIRKLNYMLGILRK